MTRERPILFSDEMVRAILAGTKTVTRRPVLSRDDAFPPSRLARMTSTGIKPGDGGRGILGLLDGPFGLAHLSAPCDAGDLRYVRETHAVSRRVDSQDQDFIPGFEDEGYTWDEVYYRASPREGLRRWVSEAPEGQEKPHRIVYLDESTPLDRGPAHRVERWTPSVHMPKWAARIWLKVTAVRVERLQDITNQQAMAEGFEGWGGDPLHPEIPVDPVEPRDEFREVWAATYGNQPGLSWGDNPWVWVIEFERVEAP